MIEDCLKQLLIAFSMIILGNAPNDDPDEARRARGEADFLTARALKLSPNESEIKKLRDEVVKLLELKTN